jgi:hypothetical protein
MTHIRNFKPWVAALVCVSLGILSGPILLAAGAGATARPPFPASSVDFTGYGDGSGYGMGQWGAFGYAAIEDETYQWILSHYYGGTILSASGNIMSKDPMISVELTENAGDPVVVESADPFTVGGISFLGGRAVRAVLSGGKWSLSAALRCRPRHWTPEATGLTNPVAVPSSARSDATVSQVLTVCEGDGANIAVRGKVVAYDSPSGAVTLNVLPAEEYVRSVISAEVSWSWGLFGGTTGSPQGQPWGFQSLEAQAVATRSYLAAEIAAGGWRSYATTCDSDCQSYPGMATEVPILTQTAADTAGQILELPGTPATSTTPATPATTVFTEYSASSGGYTTPGQFPAVVDTGDSVCIKSEYFTCNPCHEWTAAVPVAEIDSAFPSIGELADVTVAVRNGLGPIGGRVETIDIVGTTGVEVSATGDSLGPLLAENNRNYCSSDLYEVTNAP